MLCKICGTETNDGAEICAACAEKQQEQAAEPEVQEQVNEQPEKAENQEAGAKNPYIQINTEEIKKGVSEAAEKATDMAKEAAGAAKAALNGKNRNLIIIIAAAAAAFLILVIALLIIFSKPAYEKPVDYFITSISTGNYKTFKKALPKYVIKELEDGYFDIEDAFDMLNEELEDEYGRNVKVTYKVKRKTKLDRDDLDDAEDLIDDNYDKEVKVSKGYTLKIEMTVKGKKDSEKTKFEVNVYKIDGQWYILNMPWY